MSDLRIGIIGLDISHASRFREILNDPSNPHHVPGGRIVKAYPGGTDTFHLSASRVPQFSQEYAENNIELTDSIENMTDCDAFCILSSVGDQHLEQFKAVAKFGKRVFIDKPLACSYKDALAIARIAREYNTAVTTTSSFRFAHGIDDILQSEDQTILNCQVFGKMDMFEDYRDYFWYGVHGCDILYRMMGTGCKAVHAITGEPSDLLVGHWHDGRLGTILTKRGGRWGFGCAVLTDSGYRHGQAENDPPSYALLIRKLLDFFAGGEAPVDIQESLEIMAFLEAASRSRTEGGKLIEIASVL